MKQSLITAELELPSGLVKQADEVFESQSTYEKQETETQSVPLQPLYLQDPEQLPQAQETDDTKEESHVSVEERLIDKIAEFEGKVEALQSLKSNLYSAIEQLEKERAESEERDRDQAKITDSTSAEDLEAKEQEQVTENQIQEESERLPSLQEIAKDQEFKISSAPSSINEQEQFQDKIEVPSQELQETETIVQPLLKLNEIPCSSSESEDTNVDEEQVQVEDTSAAEKESESVIEEPSELVLQVEQEEETVSASLSVTDECSPDKLSQDQPSQQQQRIHSEGCDSKLKKILDDFFTQVELEGAQRAQQKKRQYNQSQLAGKENAPANSAQLSQDTLETPKNGKLNHEEELQMSPLKKRSHAHQQQQQHQVPPMADEETRSAAVADQVEQRQSPGKQEPYKEVDQEVEQQETSPLQEVEGDSADTENLRQVKEEVASEENKIKVEGDSSTESEELQRRKAQLQKEKDSLRAPFSELNNTNQKKRSDNALQEPVKKKNRMVDVNKTIFVDSYILNYSTFFPGKLLGSTLNVGNLSNSEQIVELSIDSNSFQFNKKQINEKFSNPELPFVLDDGKAGSDNIVNSEIKHEAWYIENPISKELTKRITLKLGPKAEQDFIIVVRSPNAKRSENLLSIINIGLLTYADEQFGVKESFEDFLKVNYNNSMKEFLRDRKKVAQQQRIEILLAGKVEVPSLICQKELVVSDLNEKVVPLVVKKGQACQKFRIPFKNNGPQDLELDFNFAKQSAVICGPLSRNNSTGSEGKGAAITQSPIEFVSMPSNVKIPANGTAILNIAAKLKNSYQLASIGKDQPNSNKEQKAERYNHLLIAKIKDTQIMFSFIIEASVLEASGTTMS